MIYFGDETACGRMPMGSGLRHERPDAGSGAADPAGETLDDLRLSPRGEEAFRIVDSTLNAERFMEFLAALVEDAPRKVILVVDNFRVRYAKVVSDRLADQKNRTELAFMPPYNPVTRRPTPTNT